MRPNPKTLAAMEIEEQLIAGVLMRPKDFYHAETIITESDFITPGFAKVWNTFREMAKDGIEFWRESVMVAELLKRGAIDALGGSGRLADLATKTTPGWVVYHAEQVVEWAERRRIIEVIDDAKQTCDELAFNADDLISDTQQRLNNAKQSSLNDTMMLGDAMGDYFVRLEEMRESKQSMPSVPTGFPSIDQALSGGIPLGSYVVIGARASMGKTALAMDLGMQMSSNGDPVLFVSLEMTNDQISQRLFARNTDVSMYRLQTVSYTDGEATEMLRTSGETKDHPIYIWQASGASIARIESKIRSEIARRGVKVAIIDYLGLIRGTDGRQNIYERVTMISNELARISKQLNIALIVLCQLGRAAEGEVPTVANLRDSGAIEQDADIIMLLHRDKRDADDAKLIIDKLRNGKVCSLDMKFDGKRFSDAYQAAADLHRDFLNDGN